ncbi:MAG: hypothetical protein ACON4H_03820 [Rubripirellula sp.]
MSQMFYFGKDVGFAMATGFRVLVFLVALTFAPAVTKAQFGPDRSSLNGAGMVVPGGAVGRQLPLVPSSPKVILPSSATADAVRQQLDAGVSLESIDCALVELDVVLSEKLGSLPISIDHAGLKQARVGSDARVQGQFSPQPLRAVLDRMLRPHGLRAVVVNDGLRITADFRELSQRGIGTSRWLGVDEAFSLRVETALSQKVAVDFNNETLANVAKRLSEKMSLPVVLDVRSLEEIGMAADLEVTLSIEEVSIRTMLTLLLTPLELTYRVDSEVLVFTTKDSAELNLVSRIYWLEGTGFPVGDMDSVIDVIQGTLNPEFWEQLGGPGVINTLTEGYGNRPAIIVSATQEVHRQIETLLTVMRESHVGDDPVLHR